MGRRQLQRSLSRFPLRFGAPVGEPIPHLKVDIKAYMHFDLATGQRAYHMRKFSSTIHAKEAGTSSTFVTVNDNLAAISPTSSISGLGLMLKIDSRYSLWSAVTCRITVVGCEVVIVTGVAMVRAGLAICK